MINKAIIIGHVGGDPDIRSLPDGGRVANFTLATSERWNDKDGNKQERTEWHRITIWNEGLVKVVESYVKKGSKLYVEGQLQTRKWQDKDGVDRYTTEIVLKPYRGEIKLLDSKQDTQDNQSGNSTSGNNYDKSGGDYATASGHYSRGGAAQAEQGRKEYGNNEQDPVPF